MKLILVSLIIAVTSSGAAALVATDWQSAGTSTAQGGLGGITVNMTNVGSVGSAADILFYDLSVADYAPLQLSASQECLDYAFDTNWTATFSSPVSNLMLYCKFWRGPNNSFDPTNFEYEFDTPFTILTGMSNCSIVGNTLVVPSTIFQDGVLLFAGPLTSISLISNNSNSVSRQGLTFALEDNPVASENCSWGSVKALYR